MIPTLLGYQHLYVTLLRILSISNLTNLLAVVQNIGNLLN